MYATDTPPISHRCDRHPTEALSILTENTEILAKLKVTISSKCCQILAKFSQIIASNIAFSAFFKIYKILQDSAFFQKNFRFEKKI